MFGSPSSHLDRFDVAAVHGNGQRGIEYHPISLDMNLPFSKDIGKLDTAFGLTRQFHRLLGGNEGDGSLDIVLLDLAGELDVDVLPPRSKPN